MPITQLSVNVSQIKVILFKLYQLIYARFEEYRIHFLIWWNIVYTTIVIALTSLFLIVYCFTDKDGQFALLVFRSLILEALDQRKSTEERVFEDNIEFWTTFTAFRQISTASFLFSGMLLYSSWRLRRSIQKKDLELYEENFFIISCLCAILLVPCVVKAEFWYLGLFYGDTAIFSFQIFYIIDIILKWRELVELENWRRYLRANAAPAA